MQDGHEAVAELERTTRQLGFKGVEVLTNVSGREPPQTPIRPNVAFGSIFDVSRHLLMSPVFVRLLTCRCTAKNDA
jgi:hypothetical protein